MTLIFRLANSGAEVNVKRYFAPVAEVFGGASSDFGETAALFGFSPSSATVSSSFISFSIGGSSLPARRAATMFSIFLVFAYGLGQPDGGLFVGTYIGYWFVGLAMLSIGMVASFLTSNLTVGFILGMIFNLPLALFGVADWIVKNPYLAQAIKRWSAAEQFADFQRGEEGLHLLLALPHRQHHDEIEDAEDERERNELKPRIRRALLGRGHG